MTLHLLLFAMLLPTSLLASTQFPDSDEVLLESVGPSQVVTGPIWTSEIAASNTCQVMQAQGYDKRIWTPIIWVWGWTCRIVKGATQFTLLIGLGVDTTEHEKEEQKPDEKRKIVVFVILAGLFVFVIISCYKEGVAKWCADVCASMAFNLIIVGLLMLVPLALGILGSILTLLLIMMLFPLAQKLQWYSMQNAILVCMPWPNGQYVAIGSFVLPLYAAQFAWSIKKMKDPHELLPSNFSKIFLFVSLYFSAGTMISAVGTQPWWFLLLWSLTLVGEIVLLPRGLQTEDANAYQKLVHLRLRVKLLPQAVLAACKIIVASAASGANVPHSSVDQYQIYSITTTVADILRTMIQFRHEWYTCSREPLDTSLACPLVVE